MSVAPLKTVSDMLGLMAALTSRQSHLPGMGVFHGFQGFGKTTAAVQTALEYDAIYVQMKATMTRKAMLFSILRETGTTPARTENEMFRQVVEVLTGSQRPLMVDEADTAVALSQGKPEHGNHHINLLRNLHDASRAPVLLIGEEGLPQSLQRWPRIFDRVLQYVAAQPADAEDAALLAALYCPKVRFDPRLLEMITRESKGFVRRICINLEHAREKAARHGWTEMGVKEWGQDAFHTGAAPARRVLG
ncbi:MAG: ATP-binding protein [Magnetococcales bacterium]|nr:ATP-binding protein [Magnetococcales bacterium]